MSHKPKFDMSLNLGHLIIAATMIASVAGAWSNVDTRLDRLEQDVVSNTKITNKFDVVETQLKMIHDDLKEINDKLE